MKELQRMNFDIKWQIPLGINRLTNKTSKLRLKTSKLMNSRVSNFIHFCNFSLTDYIQYCNLYK
jgi:hypothetical protein